MGIRIGGGQIEKLNGKEVSYSEFVEKYMAKNQPVVLTGLMDDWRACKDWVTENGQPNLLFFSTHFGKSKVQVADCGIREFTDQKRVEMSVSEFVKNWLENSIMENSNASTNEANDKSVLYLKDWHFAKDPGLLFMLMFSDHIVGQQINLKGCVYNIFDDVSETDFPGFKKTIWLECTQEQNEIIFVPSGWYHQVHNLEDTISINHNWFNGYNLSWVWDLLLRDYNEAKEYIEDIRDICDDFEGLCQRNLAANTGMNFYDFFSFISRFSLVNVVILFHLRRDYENQIWSSSPVARHLALNLVSIRKIALKMKSVNDVAGSFGFFMDLKETLDDPKFLKLCMGFCRTYGMIHEEEKWTCEIKKALMLDFEDYDSLISSPEDLVKFIDFAAGKFSGNCSEENILLSRLEDG
ncbi:JmjC domain-containing protein [Citrus sinensis]|uniref:JmjC domain-containing protein n=1 Tax=Citrus sinensis TaxID=2711 RepID=A0ACB8LSN9_CITSI|nr:JmjC domain-containing protein [Citrus sinensis]